MKLEIFTRILKNTSSFLPSASYPQHAILQTMPTKAVALVLDGINQPFELREILVDDPLENELLIKVTASGICHSDVSVQTGTIPGIAFPAILGHEGSGVVAKVGSAVTGFKEGDKILLSFNYCGSCRICAIGSPASCTSWPAKNFACTRLNGEQTIGTQVSSSTPVRGLFFGQSSFASYTLAMPNSCIKVPQDTDLTLLGPLGCGIQTGAGSVLNVLKPTEKDSIAIFGMGGVGIAALMAAKSLNIKTIIAVDIIPSRLSLATELGATHVINGMDPDVVAQVAKITNGDMLNFTIDASGNVGCMETAWACLGIFGKHGQLGAPPPDRMPRLPVSETMMAQKSFIGIMLGNSNTPIFLPKLVKMTQDGSLQIGKITTAFPIADFQKAFDGMHDGSVIKPIIVF